MTYRPLNDVGFLLDARDMAQHSKDPSTQVCAIIVRPDRTKCGEGFNGFPRGVLDTPDRYEDRDTKYKLVVHAELNAVITCNDHKPLTGCTLYVWPLPPCHECAKAIIQAGIRRVVSPVLTDEERALRGERWAESHRWSDLMFREAGVEHVQICLP